MGSLGEKRTRMFEKTKDGDGAEGVKGSRQSR